MRLMFALFVCCAAAFPSLSATAQPVFFNATELGTGRAGGLIFDSQACLENSSDGELGDEFFVIVMPADVETALLANPLEFWSPNNIENYNVGILNCGARESSLGIVNGERVRGITWPKDIYGTSDFLKEYIEGLASDPSIDFLTTPNNVAQNCICDFLASDAWPEFQQARTASYANHNVGGN